MDQKKLIIKILNLLGANRLNSGYNYIMYGLLLLLENDRRILNLIKSLYVDIAAYYNTSWNCVEKNIRHIIKSIWISENDDILKSIFGISPPDKRPTNKEFFQKMYDFITHYENKNIKHNNLIILCPVSHQYCKSFAEYCINALNANEDIKV